MKRTEQATRSTLCVDEESGFIFQPDGRGDDRRGLRRLPEETRQDSAPSVCPSAPVPREKKGKPNKSELFLVILPLFFVAPPFGLDLICFVVCL